MVNYIRVSCYYIVYARFIVNEIRKIFFFSKSYYKNQRMSGYQFFFVVDRLPEVIVNKKRYDTKCHIN